MMSEAADMATITATRKNRIVVVSPSPSESSTSSSESDVDAVPCGGITCHPRHSIHLERTPARDLRPAKRVVVTKGRGDFEPPRVSSHVLPLRGLDREGKQKKRVSVPVRILRKATQSHGRLNFVRLPARRLGHDQGGHFRWSRRGY